MFGIFIFIGVCYKKGTYVKYACKLFCFGVFFFSSLLHSLKKLIATFYKNLWIFDFIANKNLSTPGTKNSYLKVSLQFLWQLTFYNVFKSTKNYMVKSAFHLPKKKKNTSMCVAYRKCASLCFYSGHMFNFFKLSDEGQLYNHSSGVLSAEHFRIVDLGSSFEFSHKLFISV